MILGGSGVRIAMTQLHSAHQLSIQGIESTDGVGWWGLWNNPNRCPIQDWRERQEKKARRHLRPPTPTPWERQLVKASTPASWGAVILCSQPGRLVHLLVCINMPPRGHFIHPSASRQDCYVRTLRDTRGHSCF